MGEQTEISWATHTFNPWMGCTKVSPACANCYAERERDHRFGQVQWGPNGTRRMTADWRKPLKWNRDAEAAYRDVSERYPLPHQPDPRHFRPRVFCASLADVFEDWQGLITSHDGDHVYRCQECGHVGLWPVIRDNCPGCAKPVTKVHATMNDLRAKLFRLIDSTPWLDWLLLTKRPENIRRMWPVKHDSKPIFPGAPGKLGEPVPCIVKGARRDNVWLGTSVENQEYADKRIPELLACCDLSPVQFLSCEPLLGPVNLRTGVYQMPPSDESCGTTLSGIDWVIAGGESGPSARPSQPNWFRSLRDQCGSAGVAFHFKQWGEWAPDGCGSMIRVGKKAAGRLLDGVEHNAFPSTEHARA